MSDSLVTFEKLDNSIGMLTLNRAKSANALSVQLLDDLNQVIKDMNNRNDIHVLILTGAGDKVFCAGADLKERNGMSNEEVIKTVQYIGETITNIEELRLPVIAAINGAAFGGGLELALACDIRIAKQGIRLGLTETSLAIIPGAGGTQRLPRLIGIGQAKRLIYTAQPIDAQEAQTIGLVEEISVSDLVADALSLARTIAGNGPIAINLAKKAINEGMQVDLSKGISLEHDLYLETIETKDRLEGLEAFSEKRKPKYQGK